MANVAKKAPAIGVQYTQQQPQMTLCHFTPRRCTQRHCDHLENLQSIQYKSRERKIECHEVALLLNTFFSQGDYNGYWEVDGQSSTSHTWVSIVCCDTFELLVQCPPGKTITLGNLDLVVILESCLEDANGEAFARKLTSTAKCWPAGHVRFNWMLRGTWAHSGPITKSPSAPEVQRRTSVWRLFGPVSQLQRPQITPAQPDIQHRKPLMQRASSLFRLKRQSRGSTSSASRPSSSCSQGTDIDTS